MLVHEADDVLWDYYVLIQGVLGQWVDSLNVRRERGLVEDSFNTCRYN